MSAEASQFEDSCPEIILSSNKYFILPVCAFLVLHISLEWGREWGEEGGKLRKTKENFFGESHSLLLAPL